MATLTVPSRNTDHKPLLKRAYGDDVQAVTSLLTRQAPTPTPCESGLYRNRGLEREAQNRIQARLEASSYQAVRRVRCNFEDGVLALHGTVPGYHCVQVAISIVQDVAHGDVQIENCLEVV